MAPFTADPVPEGSWNLTLAADEVQLLPPVGLLLLWDVIGRNMQVNMRPQEGVPPPLWMKMQQPVSDWSCSRNQ